MTFTQFMKPVMSALPYLYPAKGGATPKTLRKFFALGFGFSVNSVGLLVCVPFPGLDIFSLTSANKGTWYPSG